jgi:hypothetical protein
MENIVFTECYQMNRFLGEPDQGARDKELDDPGALVATVRVNSAHSLSRWRSLYTLSVYLGSLNILYFQPYNLVSKPPDSAMKHTFFPG